VHLTAEEAERKPPDFLVDDLPRRIAKKRVVFHLKAQLAAAGNQTKDPSRPWPDNRKVVDITGGSVSGLITTSSSLLFPRRSRSRVLSLDGRDQPSE
jgi:hypothetical protein